MMRQAFKSGDGDNDGENSGAFRGRHVSNRDDNQENRGWKKIAMLLDNLMIVLNSLRYQSEKTLDLDNNYQRGT